jgi:hypothetical protein
MSKRKKKQNVVSINTAEALQASPVFKALEEAKAGMARLKKTVLHEQLHAVLKALLEAKGWDMLLLEGSSDEDQTWFFDKLADVATPLLESEAVTACCRNGLPHEEAYSDLFISEVVDAALDAAAEVLECAGNADEVEAVAVAEGMAN